MEELILYLVVSPIARKIYREYRKLRQLQEVTQRSESRHTFPLPQVWGYDGLICWFGH